VRNGDLVADLDSPVAAEPLLVGEAVRKINLNDLPADGLAGANNALSCRLCVCFLGVIVFV